MPAGRAPHLHMQAPDPRRANAMPELVELVNYNGAGLGRDGWGNLWRGRSSSRRCPVCKLPAFFLWRSGERRVCQRHVSIVVV